MFAGFVWLAYSEGVARGRGEAPVITADAGPARVAPANPGGAPTPYKGFKVYEQPAPPDDDTSQNAAQSAAASAAPPAAAPAKPVAAPAVTVPPVTAQAAPPKPAMPTEVPVAAAPVKPAPAPTKMAAVTAAPKPAPAPAKPAAAPAQPIGPATAPPRALNSPTTVPPAPAKPAAAPAVPVAAAPAASGGSVVLQIGAYKSQADANTAWTIYKSKHSALLAGYAPDVQQADLGEKGTWYRLRIAGFPSRDVASGLCDRLKADGGTCFLGK